VVLAIFGCARGFLYCVAFLSQRRSGGLRPHFKAVASFHVFGLVGKDTVAERPPIFGSYANYAALPRSTFVIGREASIASRCFAGTRAFTRCQMPKSTARISRQSPLNSGGASSRPLRQEHRRHVPHALPRRKRQDWGHRHACMLHRASNQNPA
jgi:hypothetical protein